MEDKKWTINNFNQMLDYTKIVNWKGANGISYRYFLPHDANVRNFHVEALTVRSVKGDNTRPSRSKYHWGKVYKPGQYQPLGDFGYFACHPLNKMSDEEKRHLILKWYKNILITILRMM